jgi:hypothetical protein
MQTAFVNNKHIRLLVYNLNINDILGHIMRTAFVINKPIFCITLDF